MKSVFNEISKLIIVICGTFLMKMVRMVKVMMKRYTVLTLALLFVLFFIVILRLNDSDDNDLIDIDESELTTGGLVLTAVTYHPRSSQAEEKNHNGLACSWPEKSLQPEKPMIFVITPTYWRPTQMADMTRLSQTLSLVKQIVWIVVEDSHVRTRHISQLLNRTNVPSIHLLGPRPAKHMDRRSGRGVSNRRIALLYLRERYANTTEEGVIYFADDDNTYDIRLFEEMRDTKKVSVFPVGLIGEMGISSPIVSTKTGKVIGFYDPCIKHRKYAVDMAGFAVSLHLFLLSPPNATMPYRAGAQENYFISSLGVQLDDLEPKANNCTEVLVWHTRTEPVNAPNIELKDKAYYESNLPLLNKNTANNT